MLPLPMRSISLSVWVGPQELVDDGVSKEELLLLIGNFETYGRECSFGFKAFTSNIHKYGKVEKKNDPGQYSYWPPSVSLVK